MRLNLKSTLVLAAAAASLSAAAWAGAAASRQATCSSSDVPCRLTQIEASLARIERAVGAGGGATAGVAGQVSMASSERCVSDSHCQQKALAACQAAGFSRGVPGETRLISPSYYELARVTCLD